MTIDEAIEKLKYDFEIDMYIHDIAPQLAWWLEELKSYRAHIFSGDMTQAMLKEEYYKAVDDFAEKLKEECRVHYIDCDPYFGGITDSILYEDDIDDIAEQLKGDANNGTDSQ